MRKKSLNKFIVFMFVYILIIFPLALFTDELFPLSRFPMYASNTLSPCGYHIYLYKNNQSVSLATSKATSLFLKYSRDVISRNTSSNAEMCQFIRKVFWPKNIPYDTFYVKRYCTNVKNLPSLEFDEQILLTCY